RIAGERADEGQVAAAVASRSVARSRPTTSGALAVLPIHGVIMPRANMLNAMSGGTSFDALTVALRAAVADNGINTIILDIDSPGGSVAGATEFAHELRKARTIKRVIAQSEHTMASAAYWIGANATKIVASPSSFVGSIGVYTI